MPEKYSRKTGNPNCNMPDFVSNTNFNKNKNIYYYEYNTYFKLR